MHDNRGSLWRRWDLHIHTPASGLNNQFGCTWDQYIRDLLLKAHRHQIAAIGVTDYLSVEGYRSVRNYLADEDKLRKLLAPELATNATLWTFITNLLILPNVELRLTNLVPTKQDGKVRRVNLHAIFSNDVDVQDIEENFLGRLEFVAESAPDAKDDTKTLTRSNIEKLGRRLKAAQGFSESDFTVGCSHVAVNHEAITELLQDQRATFADKYVLVLADEDVQRVSFQGQDHLLRKVLYQKAHFFFTSNPSARDHFLAQEFADEFGRAKASLWGSDAHSLERLFEVDLERYCWIKADRSFGGLLQVTNEPAARVYLGAEPPTVTSIRKGQRRYIKRLTINKTGQSLPEQWFSGTQLDLNPELIAVIGRKGSGKSALADIVALLGHSKARLNDFAFLNDERFRKLDGPDRTSRAAHFEAELTWNNNERFGPVTLDTVTSIDQMERVKYLPQGYIEKICGSRDPSSSFDLEAELNRVIFSNLSPADRQGYHDLSTLLDDETSEIKRSLSRLKAEVRGLNIQILQLEDRLAPAARTLLQEKISSRENDLKTIDEAPPAVVPEPSTDVLTKQSVEAALTKLRTLLDRGKALDATIDEKTAALAATRVRLSKLAKFAERLDEIGAAVTAALRDFGQTALETGIKIDEILNVQIERTSLVNTLASLRSEASKLDALLDANNDNGLIRQRTLTEKEVNSTQAELDAPNRRYQVYMAEVASWQKRKRDIEGDAATPNSIVYLKLQLQSLTDVLPEELAALRIKRDEATASVFGALEKLLGVYRHYYARVDTVLTARPEYTAVGLQFHVALSAKTLADRFFAMITQSVAGTFCGVEEGRGQLDKLVREHAFDSPKSTVRFVHAVLRSLHADVRSEPHQPADLARQLRKGVEVKQLLDYLFTLEFLEPQYELRMGERTLRELSPGERGLLLLFFYLAIDQDSIPLILDQPDENLDNESIKETLVPLIRDAKKRRQIIVVTHNPNLAVVCDAEQVIYAKMDASELNKVTYRSGAIENPEVNKHIVNVLEGTPPAFKNREQKYRIVGSLGSRA